MFSAVHKILDRTALYGVLEHDILLGNFDQVSYDDPYQPDGRDLHCGQLMFHHISDTVGGFPRFDYRVVATFDRYSLLYKIK